MVFYIKDFYINSHSSVIEIIFSYKSNAIEKNETFSRARYTMQRALHVDILYRDS